MIIKSFLLKINAIIIVNNEVNIKIIVINKYLFDLNVVI